MTYATLGRLLSAGALALILAAAPLLTLASGNDFRPHSAGLSLEVSISDDNSVTVRGAKVTEVSGQTVIAETLWGASRLTWTLRTNDDTALLRQSGAPARIADITAGDYISFSGRIDSSQPPFTVQASSLRDWTLVEGYKVFKGTVESVDAQGHTFVLLVDQTRITVKTNASTSYAKGGLDSFAGIGVGDTVLASGNYSAGAKVLTAAKLNMLEKVLTHDVNKQVAFASWFDRVLPRFFGN
jgi:hypothetical protein